MKLGELIEGIYRGRLPMAVKKMPVPAVWDDSRRVTIGSLFVAMSGVHQKGDNFIDGAVARGAKIVILGREAEARFNHKYPGVCVLGVSDPRKAFQVIVDRFYAHPSKKVKVIGITGTNGKTTITYFLESIIAAAGQKSGVVGTINCRVGKKITPVKNTTPGVLDNQMFLAGLLQGGIDRAVMEVSSHALDQGRITGIDFSGAVFTNLTGDHIDYHKNMERYFQAKSLLFRGLTPKSYAVINQDDEYGRRLFRLTRARMISYGLHAGADVRAVIKEFDLKGSRFKVHFFGQFIELKTHFIGYHNIYNMLAAFTAGLGEGFSPEVIKEGIESLEHVPGRLERVANDRGFAIFIDYAHTDDGLRNVLECLKEVPHKRLILMFGCGGDRDRTKRPRMGRIASDLADHVIVTSDNPRSEDPAAIIQEIIPGFTRKNFEIVVDRREAIKHAVNIAKSGDIVLLAGKGHETYQVLKDGTVDFVESDIVRDFLKDKSA